MSKTKKKSKTKKRQPWWIVYEKEIKQILKFVIYFIPFYQLRN